MSFAVPKLTNGQLFIGSTGQFPVAASLTAGANVTITPGAGSIIIAAASGATINPTNAVVPQRSNATTFVDSPITGSVPASMVDGLTITGAATANPATVGLSVASGNDTNIRLGFTSKGAGNFVFTNGGLLLPDFGAEAGSLSIGFTSAPTTGIWLNAGAMLFRIATIDQFSVSANGIQLNNGDNGLQRSAAGVIRFTDGGSNANGSWLATNGTLSGNLVMSGAASIIRLKSYTVATLPAGTQGDTAYVTDALAPTFLATVVGGGAVVTPVFFNGTNWVGF